MQSLVLCWFMVAGSFAFHSVDPPRQDCVTRPGPYSQCSAPCGGGTKTRQLQIIKQRIGYGRECPPLTETVPCNTQPCAVDCVVQPGVYGACSATCGQGTQIKVDRIVQESLHGGRACPLPSQLRTSRPCPGLPPCPQPIDCEVAFTQYSQCTAPCGGGQQTRTAFIVREAENGGAPCPSNLNELADSRQCNTDIPCAEAKNCEFVQGEYGECSAQCGQGVQTRKLYIIAGPENGGLACPSNLVESRPCSAGPCPQPQDCQIRYTPFTPCSATCGGGVQTSQGQVIAQAAAGGAPCPGYGQLNIQRSCGNAACAQISPRDCEIEYGQYSECSVTCGGGFRTRKGYVKNEAENGGLQCPAQSQLTERVPCNQQACPVPKDCVVQKGYWSKCTANCGGGQQTRQLTIVQQAEYGGLPCPSSLSESRPCNTQACGYGQQQNIATVAHQPITRNVIQRQSVASRFNAPSRSSLVFSPSSHAQQRPSLNNQAKTSFQFNSYQQ